MSWAVPLTDVAVSEQDVEAVLDCLRSGWLTMGPRTLAFEEAFARHTGCGHAVAVSSGTAALHLALLAAGVGPGDEVIVPAFTFVASAAAVRYTGAEPVLVDVVDEREPNIDPARVAEAVTARTRAVIAVHFWGYSAQLDSLQAVCDANGLALIEDAAQAVDAQTCDGRKVGTVGALGCFSFFSKKQLCVGEGGMVVSDDERLAARVRSLRSHAMTSVTWDRHRGHAESYDVIDIGFNYRLDEPRAALGLSRLIRLDAEVEARRQRARRYRLLLGDLPGIQLPFDEDAVRRSSHFAFPILLADAEQRERVRAALRGSGIQTTWYPSLSALSEYRAARGSDAVTRSESVAARHLALPLWSKISDAQQDDVVRALGAALAPV